MKNNNTSKRTSKTQQFKKSSANDRKFSRRDKGRDAADSSCVRQDKYNDPMWYAKNEAILRDAASYSYNRPLGATIPSPFGALSSNVVSYASQVVPGVMSHVFAPTIGVSTTSQSPANLAANNIYSYVRYMNSGAKNYDQADLMLYLLAMDSLYMAWNWGKRIYGYLSVYSQKNYYLPRALAAADNINLDDFRSNIADFRAYLNIIAAQITSFCVPATMPFFIRHSWMVSNIYKDSDTDKAQLYMFRPALFYKYSETTSKYGGSLTPTSYPANCTFAQFKQMLNTMLGAVSYSEDIGVMSGDILKAYGQEKLFKLTAVDPDYAVLPVYNEEVLNQMHNSTCIPIKSTELPSVTQDPTTGFLVWEPTISMSRDDIITNFMVNMPWNEVTPANTMVGTRLITALEPGSQANTAYIKACGSEIIIRRDILYYHEDTLYTASDTNDTVLINAVSTTNLMDEIQEIQLLSQFDWHPMCHIFAKVTDSQGYIYVGRMGDINNYTILSQDNIEQLHLTALMSEFNVPQLGSF